MCNGVVIDIMLGSFVLKVIPGLKPRDLGLHFFHCSAICQLPRQQRYHGACKISERHDQYDIKSRDFKTSRDLVARGLTA